MTRRERLERKVERREEWAAKAAARSSAAFGAAHAISDRIPFGQPILVGHHSEGRARRDAAKIHRGMDRAVEESKLAAHHESKGAGLARQLDRTIFDDDPDAIARLEARIALREASAEKSTAINKAWRKGGREALRGLTGDRLGDQIAHTMTQCPWLKSPCSTVGDRAAIRADKERIATIRARQERAAAATSAHAGVLIEGAEYVRITFPEKPSREVLGELRAAAFRWSGGSWHGKREALPPSIGGAPCAWEWACTSCGRDVVRREVTADRRCLACAEASP